MFSGNSSNVIKVAAGSDGILVGAGSVPERGIRELAALPLGVTVVPTLYHRPRSVSTSLDHR